MSNLTVIFFLLFMPGSTDLTDPDIIKATSHLKHENKDNWPDILKSWSTTHKLRRKGLKETRPQAVENAECLDEENEISLVNEYLNEWGVFKHPSGHLLVWTLVIHVKFTELYFVIQFLIFIIIYLLAKTGLCRNLSWI